MANDKQSKLESLKAKILADDVCRDLAEQATQLVFGEGSADAQLLFVGEAPGKNEDEQGKPFIGAAGRFLDEMLAVADLNREDVYITNIVKYRPPNNRDPLPEEKTAFLPYLHQQIDIIKPKLVVTLGRHSMEVLLPPGLKISEVHGQPQRIRMSDFRGAGNFGADAMQGVVEKQTDAYENTQKGVSQATTQQGAVSYGEITGSASSQGNATVVILPLFHPAAALYNGALRQTLLDDFAAIPAILQKI